MLVRLRRILLFLNWLLLLTHSWPIFGLLVIYRLKKVPLFCWLVRHGFGSPFHLNEALRALYSLNAPYPFGYQSVHLIQVLGIHCYNNIKSASNLRNFPYFWDFHQFLNDVVSHLRVHVYSSEGFYSVAKLSIIYYYCKAFDQLSFDKSLNSAIYHRRIHINLL